MNKIRRLRATWIGSTAIAAGALALSACSGRNSIEVGGPVAEIQANLLLYVTIIAAVVFVLVQGLIVFIMLRYRRKNDEMPKQTHGNSRLELIWTIIPAIIIVAIAIPTVQSIWTLARQDYDMEVVVVGHQWWFEFRYPESEIVTANELHVPIGTNVRLELRSQDVLHSFGVQSLFGTRDLIVRLDPDQVTSTIFSVNEPGVYEGDCRELCGVAHARMQFIIVAHTQEEYQRWADEWLRSPAALSGEAEAGRAVFQQNCATCHTVDTYRAGGYTREVSAQDARFAGWVEQCERKRSVGLANSAEGGLCVGTALVSAPNLTHFGTRGTIGAIRDVELNEQNLMTWIQNPSDIKLGTRMQLHAAVYLDSPDITPNGNESPASLAQQEVEQLVAYLLEQKPEGGTVQPPCVACEEAGSQPATDEEGGA